MDTTEIVTDAIETSRRENRTVLIPASPDEWEHFDAAVVTSEGYEDCNDEGNRGTDYYGEDWRVRLVPKWIH